MPECVVGSARTPSAPVKVVADHVESRAAAGIGSVTATYHSSGAVRSKSLAIRRGKGNLPGNDLPACRACNMIRRRFTDCSTRPGDLVKSENVETDAAPR